MLSVFVFFAFLGFILLGFQLLTGVFDVDHCGHDTDHDTGDHAVNLTSFRGLSAGLAMFGTFGGLLSSLGYGNLVSIVAALVVGGLAHVGVSYLISRMVEAESSGNLDARTAVHKIGTVYSGIPGAFLPGGKIQVNINGEFLELKAFSQNAVESGKRVYVVEVLDGSAIVQPLNSEQTV